MRNILNYTDFLNEEKEQSYEIKYEKWKWGGYSEGYDSWYLYKNGKPIVGLSNDNDDKDYIIVRHIESKEKGMAANFILMLLNKGVIIETGKPNYNSISTSAYYMNKKINKLIDQDDSLVAKNLGKADNSGKEEEKEYKDVKDKTDNYHYKWFKK